jgi:hypothetical protein
MRDFARGEIFVSWWTDAVEEFLSTGAHGFRVRVASGTTIDSPAGVGNDQASIAINGRLRFNTATVSRVHPGGAAGTYDVFVTASEQNIVNAPQPNTDNTVYSYALAIVAAGTTPAIVAGSVDIVRKVAELTWDGAAITSVRQLVSPRSDAPIYPTAPLATFTPERVRGAPAQAAPLTVWEDSAGTSLAEMSASGALQLDGGLTSGGAGSFTGALSIGAAGLTIGGDVVLARSAANVLGLAGDTVDAAGYRVAGTALAATHLSDGASLARTGVSANASFWSVTVGGNLDHDGTGVGFYGVAPIARRTGWVATTQPADRSLDTNNTSLNEVADVLNTLIVDLYAYGLIG